MLFVREWEPGGEPGPDPLLAEFLVAYEARLTKRGASPGADPVSLVPHALVLDEEFAQPRQENDDPAGNLPYVRFLDKVVTRLRGTMPKPGGKLQLRQYDLCRSTLKIKIDLAATASEQTQVSNGIYERFAWRLRSPEWLSGFGGLPYLGWVGTVVQILGLPVAKVWRWWFLWRLNRRQALRWLDEEFALAGHNNLAALLELCQARGDEALVRRVLMKGLLRDLETAARSRRLSPRKPNRRWSYVLVLPTIGGSDSPSRLFLDSFVTTCGDLDGCPLLVLGTVSAELPPYASAIQPKYQPEERLQRRMRELYSGTDPRAGLVHVVPVSARDGEGAPPGSLEERQADETRNWFLRHLEISTIRRNRPVADWLPLVSLICCAAILLGALAYFLLPDDPGCRTRVVSGEWVGVNDGSHPHACALASGTYAAELADLERRMVDQNTAMLKRHRPYRSVVFFAPLTTGSLRGVPTGLQILRGALAAQQWINSSHGKALMPVRLVLANAGEYFNYGSAGGDRNTDNPTKLDIAQKIIALKNRLHIVAVIGITQSRGASLKAVQELGKAQIPVIASGVSGDDMVDSTVSPASYYQITAPDHRAAQILATFVRYWPGLRKLTGADGLPQVIVVFDSHDTYFSSDLKDQFIKQYPGPTSTVDYPEGDTGPGTPQVKEQICAKLRSAPAMVFYAARSGLMGDLFDALQRDLDCRNRKGRVPVLAESTDPEFILKPQDVTSKYPSLELLYSISSSPDPNGTLAGLFNKEFPGTKPDADAAEGYDPLLILSQLMNVLVPDQPKFDSSVINSQLHTVGVYRYPGESGVISLGGLRGFRYPPDKVIYIRDVPRGRPVATPLTCGIQPSGETPAVWDKGFPCPPDQ